MLLKGDKTSCGCTHKDAGKAIKENLIGHLVVIERKGSHCSSSDEKSAKHSVWTCKCDRFFFEKW